MERDTIFSQGAVWFAKDRLIEQSDKYRMWFCSICGLPALHIASDPSTGTSIRKECRLCETTKVSLVQLPYATKLVMQEFAGMNVIIRVLTSPYGDSDEANIYIGDVGETRKYKGKIIKKE